MTRKFGCVRRLGVGLVASLSIGQSAGLAAQATVAVTDSGVGASASTLVPYIARPRMAEPRIVGPIDALRSVTLKDGLHPVTRYGEDLGAADAFYPLRRLQLLLQPTDAQRAAVAKLARDQQYPESSNYHRWLTPEAYGEQFGVAPEDIARLTNWLISQGFTIDRVAKARNLITISGTNADLERAFHTVMHAYRINGQVHYANASEPRIPAALAPVVAGFAKLNDFAPRPMHSTLGPVTKDPATGHWRLSATRANGQSPAFDLFSGGNEFEAVGPADLGKIYNLQPLWDAGLDGSGESIAIAGSDGVYRDDQIDFRNVFNLPPLHLVQADEGVDVYVANIEGEADLDIQWSGAVATGALIRYVGASQYSLNGGEIGEAIVEIIDDNLDPIMNVSYGECESDLGSAGNLFFYSMYQQAAVQGISVFVASGDSGSSACIDQQYVGGLAVNGYASTPYNVAVGGTDFSGNYPAASQYWSATNDPITQESALSYIPESTWNDSCANALLFSAATAALNLKDANLEAFCNDPEADANGFISTTAGGGGPSSCIGGAGSCNAGYPKPDWQSGVPNIPADQVRDLPDVSLFSGNGAWGSFYVYCQADVSGSDDCASSLVAAGGTSFASPAIAGIMALIDEKTASRQGNPNYVLYKMAAAEYSDASTLTNCASPQAKTGNACVFYDITQVSNATPCNTGTRDCVTAVSQDLLGIVAGEEAGSGYDLASGLGSLNAANLVNGWEAAAASLLGSTTALLLDSTTTPYGTALPFTITAAAAEGDSGTPAGDVALMLINAAGTPVLQGGPYELVKGQAAASIAGLSPGSYQIFARYEGSASFAGSASPAATTTVAPAATTSLLNSSTATPEYGQQVALSVSIDTAGKGTAPTGTVTFVDSTNGTTLGVAAVTGGADPGTGAVTAEARFSFSGSLLVSGSNSLVASYSGDPNYTASTSSNLALSYPAAFTITLNPVLLSIPLSAGSAGPAAIAVMASPGYVDDPAALSFSCSSVTGIACAFTAPVAASGVVSSMLMVQLVSPVVAPAATKVASTPTNPASPAHSWTPVAAASLGFLMLAGMRRRGRRLLPCIVLLCCVSPYLGCGGSSSTKATGAVAGMTTTSLTSTSPTLPFGSAVTFTAKVASASASPAGMVTFLDNGTPVATATLATGAGSYATSALTAGAHSFTAQYGGDPADQGSVSAAIPVTVTYAATVAVMVTDKSGNSAVVQLPVTAQ